MDTNINKPKITVFIPLYNNEKYIGKTIESILKQTYQDFEILIIDDKSTDKSVEIVMSYNDPRIRLMHNDKNEGVVYTRNRGLEETHTDYIAILDSDDISLPTRLEEQIKFLETHHDFALVGTWTEIIDSMGNKTGVVWKNDISPEMIPMILLFQNCFSQSSVMIRMKAVEQNRYRSPDTDEDYDLWIQISKKWKMWNIPKILTQYRTHQTNISKKIFKRPFVENEIKNELSRLNIDINDEEMVIHKTNYLYNKPDVKDFILKREQWLLKLKVANQNVGLFSEKTFTEVIQERWLTSCSANAYVGFWIWKTFWKSDLSNGTIKTNLPAILKFFIKCLIRKT
ncbi:MAG: glycosyltransferase family 2 protein [Candidatus Zambryskibacteria bacterium]|nr:glycosyltransferase family 2 protein [Candidatus Zambryskibacteria bacterium]